MLHFTDHKFNLTDHRFDLTDHRFDLTDHRFGHHMPRTGLAIPLHVDLVFKAGID